MWKLRFKWGQRGSAILNRFYLTVLNVPSHLFPQALNGMYVLWCFLSIKKYYKNTASSMLLKAETTLEIGSRKGFNSRNKGSQNHWMVWRIKIQERRLLASRFAANIREIKELPAWIKMFQVSRWPRSREAVAATIETPLWGSRSIYLPATTAGTTASASLQPLCVMWVLLNGRIWAGKKLILLFFF